jgi:hypothetical protein
MPLPDPPLDQVPQPPAEGEEQDGDEETGRDRGERDPRRREVEEESQRYGPGCQDRGGHYHGQIGEQHVGVAATQT